MRPFNENPSPSNDHHDRQEGAGELYAYVAPNTPNTVQLSSVPPWSKQNPDYGFSVGRGAFGFEAGRWHTVAERVKLNEVGCDDGESHVHRW